MAIMQLSLTVFVQWSIYEISIILMNMITEKSGLEEEISTISDKYPQQNESSSPTWTDYNNSESLHATYIAVSWPGTHGMVWI